MTRDVIVVGAGIVGVSVARELARRPGVRVTVVERDDGPPRGSTAFAPGFIGLYNDAPVLLELARSSAQVYEAVGAGFVSATRRARSRSSAPVAPGSGPTTSFWPAGPGAPASPAWPA